MLINCWTGYFHRFRAIPFDKTVVKVQKKNPPSTHWLQMDNSMIVLRKKETKKLQIVRLWWKPLSKVKISQNFVAFSEYMNFNTSAQIGRNLHI